MQYQPIHNVFHNRSFNGGQRGHAGSLACDTGMFRPVGSLGSTLQARASSIDHPQWTPQNVKAPRPVNGQDSLEAVHGVVSDRFEMPSSTDYRLAEIRMAFAASGGLLTVGELANGNDPDSEARFAQIAKGIATREIIGFMWQSEPWVPMFQFETQSRLLPRRALQPLFKLLIPLYDAWEMANWFAKPNQWLSGLRPVDECTKHLEAVLDVAHLEHFIATGRASQQRPPAPRSSFN